jgi:hypothetical protein
MTNQATTTEATMADQVTPLTATNHAASRGRFFEIYPSFRGGGKGVGLIIVNEEKLTPSGIHTMDAPNGGLNQYLEKPHLVYTPKSGGMPRDFEVLADIWIVSEPLKQIFQAVDPEGFAFAACDFTLADGSIGPQYYLCDVVRTLDALDEEISKLKIKISNDYIGGKYYSCAGGATLVFKEDIVGSAHIFRTPYSPAIFCSRTLRDAIRSADRRVGRKLIGIKLQDATEL